MGYEYAVFISYKRQQRDGDRVSDSDVEMWVQRHFERMLQSKLSSALGYPAVVFRDAQDLKVGSAWKDEVVNALKSSVCLVPIWDPLYFRSAWCVSEWATFRTRNGPVVPIAWGGTRHFPPAAKATQWLDLGNFAISNEGFRMAPTYVEFELMVKQFADEVAAAMEQAPAFDPEWPAIVPDSEPLAPPRRSLFALPKLDEMLVTTQPKIGRSDVSPR